MMRFLFRTILILALLLVLTLIVLRIAAALRETSTPAKILAPDTHWSKDGAISHHYIETPSGRFFTLAEGPGDAQPVLLAHGTAAWSGFWQKEVSLLAQAGYRAIAFDMPPFGFSDRAPEGDYGRATQATRILDLVATFDRAPIMVAHSFGAAAATEAVLRDPTAFAGLIIVDGAIGLTATPDDKALPFPLRPRVLREAALSATVTNPMATKRLLRGLLYNKDAATDAYVDILQLPQRRTGTTAAYAEWLPALLAPATDTRSRDPRAYADLPIPVRIIWGDKDTVTPPAQAEALAKALDQAAVHYLADVGHIPHIEAPEAFMDALKELLAEMINQ